MSAPPPSNPLHILQTLDGFLKHPFQLIVYGRSALALGYPSPHPAFEATMDVDAILPAKDLETIEMNDDFWEAQAKTNDQLADAGLYFTHLFEEKQVILSPDWLTHTVPITQFHFEQLSLRRPSTHDLILTKMMRIDPQDRDDIGFLIYQNDFDSQNFRKCLEQAIIPEIPEIREAFAENTQWLKDDLLRLQT